MRAGVREYQSLARRTTAMAMALAAVVGTCTLAAAQPPGMRRVPAGSYLPLYASPKSAGQPNAPQLRVAVSAFDMDQHAVTNGEYLRFVTANPQWRKSKVKRLFADESYLRHWKGDLDPGPDAPTDSPVVYVSWFAARAYLASAGKQLPTVHQWEYAAAASESSRDASREPRFLERLRLWYGRPTPSPMPAVGSSFRNIYGLTDLHGLIWEWTVDFNSALVTGESRADSTLDRQRFCGAGAWAASDFEDYAAFMRYAFRSSLEARYTVGNLGFRGVKPIPETR